MALISTGSGATDSTTTRVTSASDDLVAAAVGTPGDGDAAAGLSSATITALLKSLQHSAVADEILLELKRIRVGIGMLVNADLTRAVQER